MDKVKLYEAFGTFLGVVLGAVISLLISATIVWCFWPTVMVEVFKLPALPFGKALVLVVIAREIFPRLTKTEKK